jgi:N-acylglucosamine-6-phosphate 2-epimerase
VVMEGHITHPDEVRRALGLGATAVVVGSAITRPQTITARFVEATQDLSKNDLAQSKIKSV